VVEGGHICAGEEEGEEEEEEEGRSRGRSRGRAGEEGRRGRSRGGAGEEGRRRDYGLYRKLCKFFALFTFLGF